MRFVAVLTRNSLRRFGGLLLISGAILAGFQLVLVEVGAYLDRTGAFSGFVNLFPGFVREMMGASFFAMLSFAGIVSLGYFHIAVLSSLTGLMIAMGTELASEIEGGFADLIMAKAIPRHVPVTRTLLVLLASSGFFMSAMMAGTLLGLKTLASAGETFPIRTLLCLAANLAALLMCWGGIALASATLVRRRATAGAFSGILALVMLLLEYLGRLWKPASEIALISPFRHFSPLEIILSASFPTRDIGILLGVALLTSAVAYVVYARRDL